MSCWFDVSISISEDGPMTNVVPEASGTEPGQRQLNGPQTTGRAYQNLSEPKHRWMCDHDVAVPMRDGINLIADIHRPLGGGRYPVLIAASPYPRQIQDVGAPMGFIEAGATDFFVPRGYVHVIANLRGTGGSGGTFGFHDTQNGATSTTSLNGRRINRGPMAGSG